MFVSHRVTKNKTQKVKKRSKEVGRENRKKSIPQKNNIMISKYEGSRKIS